jgi:hypothetical protein
MLGGRAPRAGAAPPGAHRPRAALRCPLAPPRNAVVAPAFGVEGRWVGQAPPARQRGARREPPLAARARAPARAPPPTPPAPPSAPRPRARRCAAAGLLSALLLLSSAGGAGARDSLEGPAKVVDGEISAAAGVRRRRPAAARVRDLRLPTCGRTWQRGLWVHRGRRGSRRAGRCRPRRRRGRVGARPTRAPPRPPPLSPRRHAVDQW